MKKRVMADITPDDLRDNLSVQITELESLESVFCNPGEIRVEDTDALTQINDFIAGNLSYFPPCLDLTVTLILDGSKFELCVTLPRNYPNTVPEMFVRNHTLTRSNHVKLNDDLKSFVADLPPGEPCVFTAVTWLQEHATKYLERKQEKNTPNEKKIDNNVTRFWIYSHHIYSKTKRREMIELAGMFDVTGFCLPGKPGIVCVEGGVGDCNEWWQHVRAMNWKKIFCKVIEENKEGVPRGDFLKFREFREIGFQCTGVKSNHMDMGELHKYLDRHNVGYVFKDLFGVETKTQNED